MLDWLKPFASEGSLTLSPFGLRYTFWTLAIAGILMERGALTKDGPAHSNWSTIVHRYLAFSSILIRLTDMFAET